MHPIRVHEFVTGAASFGNVVLMKEAFVQKVMEWGKCRACMLIALACVLSSFNVPSAEASGVPFRPGDVLLSLGVGRINHFTPNGTLLDTIDPDAANPELSGVGFLALDAANNLYARLYTSTTQQPLIGKYDDRGNLIATIWSGHPSTSMVFDISGNAYVGDVGHEGLETLWKLPAGTSYSPQYNFWPTFIDLAPDQCTLHYNTKQTATIKRFNVCTGMQLSDQVTFPSAYECQGLRILPTFEELVTCAPYVYRLDSKGAIRRTYQMSGTALLGPLALDPDYKSFWTIGSGNNGVFYAVRFDIATGAIITQFNTGPGRYQPNPQVFGLAIVGGPTSTTTDLGPCNDRNAIVGCPINVTNGNTYIDAQDYALPGLGGGISLHRVWNSQWSTVSPITQAGLFGDSWRSTYEERLQLVDVTHLKYWRGDGSVWSFLSVNGAWTLDSPTDQYVTLAFDSSASKFILTYRDGSQKTFTQTGYLTAVKDRSGNTTSVTYDTSNRIVQMTDAAARSLTFAYGDNNNPNQVTAISDAVGVVATYTYDATSHLLQVQYDDATTNSYVYDAAGLLTSVLDNEGRVLEAHTYDGQRRGLSSQRAGGVDLVSVTYGTNSTVQISDSVGNRSNYLFTKIGDRGKINYVSGTMCASCGAQGGGLFTFDARGNRTSSTDALGNVTTLTYDSFDDVMTRSTQVNGSTVTWSYTYNSFGGVLTATDPLGFVTTNTYDAKGNLLTTTTPSPGGRTAGSRTSFTYDAKGQLLTVTDPLNHVTRFAYTTAGLVESITDAQNSVTRFEYDARGNRTAIIAIIDATTQRTTFAYDQRNRLTMITYPTIPATSTSLTYDSRGRRTAVTDANGKTTSYSYDDADRLVAATDAQSPAGVTQYEYDSESNLLRITDPLGRPTQYEYNSDRRVSRMIFPSTKSETYTYDAVGNLISKTDRKSQTIFYAYDELRRLKQKRYMMDGTQVNYTYDAAGRLTQITDLTGAYQFAYDNMDRLTQTSTAYSFIPGKTFTVDYAWDAASNLTSMTDPQRGDNTYTYDSLNRLATLKNSQRNQFSFTYDTLGRRTQLARPNSVNTSYGYDPLSRVTSIIHKFVPNKGAPTVLDGAEYAYDAAGNRLSRTDKGTNAVSNYTYDSTYQLARVTQGANATESYSYDGVGNRLSSLNVASYTYDTSNQLTNQPGVTYTYDDNGNLASKADGTDKTNYSWDFEDRLTRITFPGGSQINFKYDPMGRRIQKSSSSGTSNYLYDHANVLEELDAAGTLITRYTQDENLDEPLSMLKSGATTYFEADGLRSITSLTNSAGALAGTYTYDSFGRLTFSTGTITNSYGFTGRELDSETGLMYYRARYYDSAVGRFLSEDPLGFAGGSSDFYTYVHNSPTNLVDPFGLADNASAWQLGWEWLSGRGQRVHHFTDGDPLTEVLRRHERIQDLINGVCNGTLPQQGTFDYRLGGLQGVPKYARDYSTLLSFGLTGNLAVTYLGSYGVNYVVKNQALEIYVWNFSTAASATHPPVLGYTDWWDKHIGTPLNNRLSSGPMSATAQGFSFHENLRRCGCK